MLEGNAPHGRKLFSHKAPSPGREGGPNTQPRVMHQEKWSRKAKLTRFVPFKYAVCRCIGTSYEWVLYFAVFNSSQHIVCLTGIYFFHIWYWIASWGREWLYKRFIFHRYINSWNIFNISKYQNNPELNSPGSSLCGGWDNKSHTERVMNDYMIQ